MQGDSGVAPPSLSTNSSPHVLTEVVVTATGGWGPRPRGWRRAPGRDVGGFRRRRAHIHVHASLFIFQQEEAGRARLPPPTPLGQTEDWASEETLWSNSENGTKPHRAPGRGGAVRSRRGTHTSWRETEAEADVDRHPRRRPLRPRLSEGPLGGCAEPRHCPRRLPPPPSLPLRLRWRRQQPRSAVTRDDSKRPRLSDEQIAASPTDNGKPPNVASVLFRF